MGHVQPRRHDLAGLVDQQVVGGVARVHRGAAGTDGGAQLVGQRGNDFLELLFAAQRPAARDDDLGGRQFGTVALDDLEADEADLARIGDGSNGLNRCT